MRSARRRTWSTAWCWKACGGSSPARGKRLFPTSPHPRAGGDPLGSPDRLLPRAHRRMDPPLRGDDGE
ncbi:hypothetical protein CA233_19395 [Sphingomonas sp. ABOLD]|nr:hypothetical protein CA233_19395 [Sphingomonas sp. ABOLD]